MKKYFSKISSFYALSVLDEVPIRAAALSYSLIFSVIPILYFCILTISLVVVGSDTESALFEILSQNFNEDVANFFRASIDAFRVHEPPLGSFIAGIIVLLVAASNYFYRLNESFRIIFKVARIKRAIFSAILRRIISLIYVILFMIILLATLNAHLFATALTSKLGLVFGEYSLAVSLFTAVWTVGILTLITSLFYRTLSHFYLSWSTSVLSAMLVSSCLYIANVLLNAFFRSPLSVTAFGFASLIALILLWVYYTHYVFLMGSLVAKEMEESL